MYNLHNIPSWNTFFPALPKRELFQEKDSREQWIVSCLGLRGDIFHLKCNDQLMRACFLLEDQNNSFWLVRDIPATPEIQHIVEFTNSLIQNLKNQEINVIAPSSVKKLPDGTMACIYPYLDKARRIQQTEKDITRLGEDLGKLHQALRNIPHQDDIYRHTQKRLHALETIRSKVCSGTQDSKMPLGHLRILARNADFFLNYPSASLQPLHGDLNFGNILVDRGKIYFIDFEDIIHSALPTAYELMYLIERFILLPQAYGAKAVTLGGLFLNAYKQTAPQLLKSIDFDPLNIIQSLALRSLLTLLLAEESGTPILEPEWNKFFQLIENANMHSQTIRKIFQHQVN